MDQTAINHGPKALNCQVLVAIVGLLPFRITLSVVCCIRPSL